MIDFEKLRKTKPKIAIIGSYPVVQPILDYDFMIGSSEPSIKFIIANGKNSQKNFFGNKEILIPIYKSFSEVPEYLKQEVNLFLNLSSGRRCYASTIEAIDELPNLKGGSIFAEETPEKFSINIANKAREKNIFIIGPSSIGLILPGFMKLGAIGGVKYDQLMDSKLYEQGNIAVFSASGGMTNEILRIVTSAGNRVSASFSFGGDRFPITSPKDALLSAEKDRQTDCIVYFGELGGFDEYEIAELIKKGKIKKKVIAYIAGVIGDAFDKPTQFGHAKAMAKFTDERSISKRKALRESGVICPDSFQEFIEEINSLPKQKFDSINIDQSIFEQRRPSMFTSTITKDVEGDPYLLGKSLTSLAEDKSVAEIVISLLLGEQVKSSTLVDFVDLSFKLAVDHGPLVSGVLNTMISARAGKDMVSSISSGLLTIGPRFGGAINMAASHWLEGIKTGISPSEFVENYAKQKKYILGIGHKKYRIDLPDPRVNAMKQFKSKISDTKFLDFALGIEKITSSKKGNLILNFDGAVAAMLLDILSADEKYSIEQLEKLVEIEFFNSFFVFPRTLGFIAHYLDQKRLDEGLFRLDKQYLSEI